MIDVKLENVIRLSLSWIIVAEARWYACIADDSESGWNGGVVVHVLYSVMANYK